MKPIFTADDFPMFYNHTGQIWADQCNAKIEKLLTEAPRVYGENNNWFTSYITATRISRPRMLTHTAVLFNIEELPKKPCEHEPDYTKNIYAITSCKHCGVELKATWSEVK